MSQRRIRMNPALLVLAASMSGCTGLGGHPNDPLDGNPDSFAHSNQTQMGGALDVRLFYDKLSPYGTWVHIQDWGWSWRPTNVAANWRPYTTGRWIATRELGWLWIADEPWGWATFHYGRWGWSDYGWLWIPGTQWAPAWVAWRTGPNVIGWSALPPGVEPEHRADDRSPHFDYWAQESAWVFCEQKQLLQPELQTRLLPSAGNHTAIRNTQPEGHARILNGRIVNDAVAPSRVETAIGRSIQPARVRQQHSISPRIETRIETHVDRNEVTIVYPLMLDRSRLAAAPVTALPAELNDPDRLHAHQTREAETLAASQQRELDDLENQHQSQRSATPAPLLDALQHHQQSERDALAQQHEQQQATLKRWHEFQRNVLSDAQEHAPQPPIQPAQPPALGRGPSANAAQHFASIGHEPEEEHRRFAREVADWLTHAVNELGVHHLSIFAATRFLGLLRQELGDLSKHADLHEGELTRLRPHELSTHPAIVNGS